MGFIFLILLNIIFVSYGAKKKIAGFSLSVALLRMLISLLSSIFYMPLIQIFMSTFRCVENTEGDMVHYLFNDIYCYTGEHLVFLFIVGPVSIIMVLIASMTAMLYFECSMTSTDITASINGHHNYILVWYFTIISFIFALFPGPEYTLMRIFSMFIGIFVLFKFFHYGAPFFAYSI